MDYNQNQDHLPQTNDKLPSNLNTLTIISLVGCGFAFLSGLYNFFTACGKLKELDKLDDMATGEGMMADMMKSAIEIAQKSCDYKVVLLLTVLATTGLCLFGVLQMRKRKKIGLPIYIVGELLYPILTFVILGVSSFGGIMAIASLFFPIIMVILYLVQKKHLTE